MSKIRISVKSLRLSLLVLLGVIVIINLFFLNELNDSVKSIVNSAALTMTSLPNAQAEKIYNVSLIGVFDSSCRECFDIENYISQINAVADQINIKINNIKRFDISSTEGSDIIKKYNITAVPTIILGDQASQSTIPQYWLSYGSIENDGTLILRKVSPPYRNLTSGGIEGLVSLILLNDSSCNSCYNVSLHSDVLRYRFGVTVINESVVDISSEFGKELLGKYNITKVPTVIISHDFNAYGITSEFWSQFGTVENDGWYVFREMSALGGGVYKDLTENKTYNISISNV